MNVDTDRNICDSALTDDGVESRDQDLKRPDDYVWMHDGVAEKALSSVLYAVARVFVFFYTKLALRMRVVNREALRSCRDRGFFLYGNHTQPIGDACFPVCCCAAQHPYTIAAPANLSVPVVGRLLPLLGILPIPDNSRQMRQFLDAVRTRIEQKRCVVIFPEAHVWPYYTKIRPFGIASFRYPADLNAPAFSATLTYRRRRIGRKPRIVAYIDGPFVADADMSRRQKQQWLHDQVRSAMEERSLQSTYEYIAYEKRDEARGVQASAQPGSERGGEVGEHLVLRGL